MFGTLNAEQVDQLLGSQLIGRLACAMEGDPYIIPISYAFHNGEIYCHAEEGKKIDIMRSNPRVCFQVDEMKDMANWKSVIVNGDFQEMKEKEDRTKVLQILLDRYLPVISSVTTHLGEHWPFHPEKADSIKGVMFKILVREKTGRFESNIQSPNMPG
jgi:nitroimidazol reductase NimA-like FMN-containing flavoprotein (pyridoxamine 5'-phosphate oxidase superfamily)